MQYLAKLFGPVALQMSTASTGASLAGPLKRGEASEPACASAPGDFEQAIAFFVATRETDANWDGRDCVGDADSGWF